MYAYRYVSQRPTMITKTDIHVHVHTKSFVGIGLRRIIKIDILLIKIWSN